MSDVKSTSDRQLLDVKKELAMVQKELAHAQKELVQAQTDASKAKAEVGRCTAVIKDLEQSSRAKEKLFAELHE